MSMRILIVDDHGVLRAGLAALLDSEADFEVVGEAEDGSQAVSQAAQLQPDVVLMDINLPDFNGIEATRRILEIVPAARILILTVHDDKSLLQEAVREGAAGYILKQAVKTELIHALHTIQKGDLYVDPALTRMLLSEDDDSPGSTKVETPLSPREIEVLQLIVQGYTNSQAGEILGISVRTVEFHRSNIMGKLQLSSRVELVRYAEQHNLTGNQGEIPAS